MAHNQIAALLETLTPLEVQRPWPRYAVTPDIWTDIGRLLGMGEGDFLALWGEPGHVHLALRAGAAPGVVSLPVSGSFPSIGRYHPAAIRFERAIRDLHGHVAEGAPDHRPWLDHGAWGVEQPLGARRTAPVRDAAAYDFLAVKGEGLHQIAVGPVHAGIIEPGHFRFTANGETVARLEQRLGYVHKGIDRLLADAPIEQAARVAARISGDSTIAYGFAFARAVEAALRVEAPPRARTLRGIMAELERLANHFGDIGAICNDASFALIHAYCGIFRERILQASDQAFGHRLMMDRIVPGGVTADIAGPAAAAIVSVLDEIAPGFARIVSLYDDTPSLQDRTCQTGIVSHALVARFGAGGYVGRGSGRAFDARRDLAYAPYEGAAFDIPVLTRGDVDARVWVRIKEVDASMALIRRFIADLPGGDIRVALPASGAGEGIAMVEAFRGEVLVWVRVEGGTIRRAYARDASWLQWPLLEAAIEGNIVADFPLCNKSFNCSYSGHDL